LYYFVRSLIRYTNIFEEDANGVSFLNFKNKVNIIDVGASDGIASKFFKNKLNVNKIICVEPNKTFVKILKKLKIQNLKVYPYGIGEQNKIYNIYYPRYHLFNKKFDLITYTFYEKKELKKYINLHFLFKKNISIIKDKIKIKKFKKTNFKIDLIKIDTNGFELSILKGIKDIIKDYKPVILLETGKDILKIEKLLKRYDYNKFLFSNNNKNFLKIKKKYPLNTYFLQKNHLKNSKDLI
jgi:FkbM family methyltransferase